MCWVSVVRAGRNKKKKTALDWGGLGGVPVLEVAACLGAYSLDVVVRWLV
jgi:hypothetical protein